MGKAQWKVPAEVDAVRVEIEAWRSSREKRGPIPSAFWTAAAALARRYSVYRISQALRLNYGVLKRRMKGLSVDASQPCLDSDSPGAGRGFIEVTGVEVVRAEPSADTSVAPQPVVDSASVPNELSIEVLDESGARMTVRISDGSGVDVGALVGSFWQRGR